MMKPFSFDALATVSALPLQPTLFVKASDGIPLAIYPVIPDVPRAILLFYHGGGIYSTSLYQSFAATLAREHQIGTVLADIRGHGHSGGARGDAPSRVRVWQDTAEVLQHLRAQYPSSPLVLGGHSSGGGLALNFSLFQPHAPVLGYIFVSPFLGADSDTARDITDARARFIKKINLAALIAHGISNGRLFRHTPAIFFNYPEELHARDKLILRHYTCAMASAVTPRTAHVAFHQLTKPFEIFIGENDEQFDPRKLLAFQSSHANGDIALHNMLPRTHHLDILLHVAPPIAHAIDRMLTHAARA